MFVIARGPLMPCASRPRVTSQRTVPVARLPRRAAPRSAWSADFVLQETSRAVMLFVFFASTLNYLHYRGVREDIDREERDGE
jgi:hypothetical protein